MAAEDFSFPAIGKTSSCGVDSPPLWHLSPAASPNHWHGNKGKKGWRPETKMESKGDRDFFELEPTINSWERKSFSYIENGPERLGDGDDDHHEDHKMDSLWEDFNEELINSRSLSETSSSGDTTVGSGCHQSLAISKTGGRLPTTTKNKPSMVLIVKVLKKLFLLHNSQLKLKKSARDRFPSYG